jgi:hypothetical protein
MRLPGNLPGTRHEFTIFARQMQNRKSGEWLNTGLGKLKDMSLVVGKELLMQLAPIETIHKKLQSRFQRFRAARKTVRAARQASQMMAQLGVISFDQVGVGFTLGDFISTQVIPQAIIGIKSVAIVAFRFGRHIHHLLDGGLGSLPHDLEAQVAASDPIYDRDHVDLVFLSPMKVNNSSISASLTSAGTGGSGSWAAWALTHKETVRW